MVLLVMLAMSSGPSDGAAGTVQPPMRARLRGSDPPPRHAGMATMSERRS
jgi:hypothetical protein